MARSAWIARAFIVLAAAVALGTASTATAHSGIASSSPKAGSVVAAFPASVTMSFTDRLRRVVSVQVLDARGVDHAAAARLDPRNAARVLVRTRTPRAGSYRVRWTVQSEDGHTQAGMFRFRAR